MSDVPTGLLEQVAIADAAAQAARSVPGVLRLQPGLKGLLKQFAAQAWERATGRAIPDLAGVEADLSGDDKVDVEVRIVVGADRCAADVGSAVHRAVAGRLETTTHRTPSVHVRIVEIDLEPDYS